MYCKENELKVPNTDAEILRYMYAKKKDAKQAYLATMEFWAFQKKYYQREISSNIFELLNTGFIYVCGRDKFYRPIVVINGYMMNSLNPDPSEDDLITSFLFFGRYV